MEKKKRGIKEKRSCLDRNFFMPLRERERENERKEEEID